MQVFHFWSCDIHPVKSAAVYKISWKLDDFYSATRMHSADYKSMYRDISIYKMATVRHLGIVLAPYETTHEVSAAGHSCLSNFMSIWHRSDDIAIWIFRMFGLKCLFRPPKWGFWGTLDPWIWLFIIETPQKAHPYVNPRLLSCQL